jgi:hypothetical protein
MRTSTIQKKIFEGDNMNVACWIALLIVVIRGVAIEAEVKKVEWDAVPMVKK